MTGRIGIAVILLFMPNVLLAQGQEMMRPRVPADKLEEARALKNPLVATAEIIEKGKALYEGKGMCINCHGASGHGDGPAAANLIPPPRVFRSHGFWQHRTEGEIFWVIKNGSPGTSMISFGGLLSDEEIWTVMQYERSFVHGHGPRARDERGPMGPGPGRGRHGMMGPGPHHEGMGPGGECCGPRGTQ